MDMLIEKLNDSINNRMYDSTSPNNQNSQDLFNEIDKRMTKNNKNKNNINIPNQRFNNLTVDDDIRSSKERYDELTPKKTLPKSKSQFLGGRNKNKTDTFSQEGDINNTGSIGYTKNTDKSNQYALSSKFFNKCRSILTKEEYSNILEILKLCNTNKINKTDTFKNIELILQPYDNLLKDFKYVFSS